MTQPVANERPSRTTLSFGLGGKYLTRATAKLGDTCQMSRATPASSAWAAASLATLTRGGLQET